MSDHLTSMQNEVAQEYRAALAKIADADIKRIEADHIELARLEMVRWKRIAEMKGDELTRITDERDMLASRCANQARQIGVLMLQEGRRLTVSAAEAIDAIRARADEDGALHFDSIKEVLVSLGARP